jgi:nucleoside-diphosphate-sugar epimerase
MTVLVTGVTGLVGERLVPRLLQAGLECRVLVRGDTTPPAGAEAVEGDLLDPASLAKAVTGVSAVVHLAAVFRTTDDELIWKTNLEGTRSLITAVETYAPEARFVLASTSHVYGPDGVRPGREDEPTNPEQAYPASKLAAENELQASSLNWSVLRFAFVYGDNDGHLESMPRLAAQAQFAFHPAARMSMIHHRDIANAIELALSGSFDGQIVNLSDDAPTTMYELFELVGEEMAPTNAPLEHPWRLHVSNSRARSLGFRPEVSSVFQAARESIL